jgi:uncharacterized protein (TIGR02145 family)
MKKIFSFLLCWRFKRDFVALCATQLLTLDFSLQAQAPQGIAYQAIARNASGVAIANTAVKVRFSIRDSIATGAIKYQETHNPTTSALGLFSVNVGMGTVLGGSFSGINWGKNAKFLQVELNTTGGTTYTDLGTTQMMSVPYALLANAIKMKTSVTGDTLYTGAGNYVIIPGVSAANNPPSWNSTILTDIEGNLYNTVIIGNQIWMKENLKTSKYLNGEPITTNLNNTDWQNTTSSAFSIYNNDAANNTNYGKLYNWYAVVDPRGLCPLGWHVPSDAEWKTLEISLGMSTADADLSGSRGGAQNVGGKMKSVSSLWQSSNTGATDESGFSGLPGGYRNNQGTFSNIRLFAYWWSSTELSSTGRSLNWGSPSSSRLNGSPKSNGYSVRCLKD